VHNGSVLRRNQVDENKERRAPRAPPPARKPSAVGVSEIPLPDPLPDLSPTLPRQLIKVRRPSETEPARSTHTRLRVRYRDFRPRPYDLGSSFPPSQRFTSAKPVLQPDC
jgi:hypothetical protein